MNLTDNELEDVRKGLVVIKTSIDRLTILGDDVGNFDEIVNKNEFGFIKRYAYAKYPYKRDFHCTDGSLIEWTDDAKFKSIRYDFNPNNIKDSKEREHRRAVSQILKTMKYPKISRIDIAIDVFGENLAKYQIYDNAQRKKNYWVDALEQLETLYIGAPASPLRVRIYDKAKEQKSSEGVQWWRIEAQMRDLWCQSVHGYVEVNKSSMRIPVSLFDPFKDIRFFIPAYKGLESVQEKAMIKLLLEEPEEIKRLGKATRAKYRKILASMPADKELGVSDIFEQHKDNLLSQILYWLRIPEANDVLAKSVNRKMDFRTKEDMEKDIELMFESLEAEDKETEFNVESVKMHMLYN
ncbi:replication initiation factor domain-containing protein [Niallia sp. NCCP-28]|uniref:replication initiation factor domain-containing protein n=1 Tax=Niallia sp. NCCP-28 TaxID=2934712 RepID=UPI002082EFD5|nr:replication initiation factor domain-containing protein [Niallia sp. NCCP-28]GKU85313.1 hypothetical protein NCCP28_47090 [Niallia sp. NCCP-28]